MLPTSAGSNPRPPGLQSDAHPTEPPWPAKGMLEESIKANYYLRFDTSSYHCLREIHLNARHKLLPDRQTYRRREIQTPMSHPTVNRCDKNTTFSLCIQHVAPDKRGYIRKILSYFYMKTYVVGTH